MDSESAGLKLTDGYLGLLFAMDDYAVYDTSPPPDRCTKVTPFDLIAVQVRFPDEYTDKVRSGSRPRRHHRERHGRKDRKHRLSVATRETRSRPANLISSPLADIPSDPQRLHKIHLQPLQRRRTRNTLRRSCADTESQIRFGHQRHRRLHPR